MSTAPIATSSSSIHGQFLEVAIALEQAVDNKAFGINYVTIDPDTETGLLTVTATIPITTTRQNGSIIITAATSYPLNAGS